MGNAGGKDDQRHGRVHVSTRRQKGSQLDGFCIGTLQVCHVNVQYTNIEMLLVLEQCNRETVLNSIFSIVSKFNHYILTATYS